MRRLSRHRTGRLRRHGRRRAPRPIRIAAQLHPQQGAYEGLRRAVSSTEDVGFDLLYTWDHFFPLYGHRDGPHFESWALLAAWAEQTSRIELGHLVSAMSYRNANLVADTSGPSASSPTTLPASSRQTSTARPA